MTNSENRSIKVTAAIAEVRKQKDSFSKAELISALKSANCPYANEIPKILVSTGVVKKEKGIFTFIFPEPVFHKKLIHDLNKVAEKVSESKKKWLDHHSKCEVTIEHFSTDDAILFLKERGFKIMRPITEYVEC
jgi:hypothetical protein